MFRDGDITRSKDEVKEVDRPTALLATLDEIMVEWSQPITMLELDQAVANLPLIIRKIKMQVVQDRNFFSAKQLKDLSWSIWEVGVLARVADSKNVQDINSGINECLQEIKTIVFA